jgi:hypothetical protein
MSFAFRVAVVVLTVLVACRLGPKTASTASKIFGACFEERPGDIIAWRDPVELSDPEPM